MPLTPDGLQEAVASWATDSVDCCARITCYDPCRAACNLIWSLPSGPMWDAQKVAALEKIQQRNLAPFDLCRPLVPCEAGDCAGLADYALFLAEILAGFVNDSVWAAKRESSPFTARDTLEDWKERLNWQDCTRSDPRTYGTQGPTAYEIEGECGPIYCPPVLPSDLQCAVDQGIVRALGRLRMGFIPNVEGINWAIEPLGAQLVVRFDGLFSVCPIDGMIDACASGDCWDADSKGQRIPACIDQTCTADFMQPDILWPGVIAAECIVKSFLPVCPLPLAPCLEEQWQSCTVAAPARPEAPSDLPECGEAPAPDAHIPINPSAYCGTP